MTSEVVITGVGILSACGTTTAEHLDAFRAGKRPALDTTTYAPFAVFPVAPFDYATAIESRSDRRQMEPWQLLGVSAAKLALDSAGLTGRDARDSLYVNLAANGGAREEDVDLSVLAELRGADDPMSQLIATLSKRIRPSFLLGQLSNMLAGNIAIVLGIGGGARTFMGETYAGVEAVSDAVARITAGQSERALVGGVFDAERLDFILSLALGGLLDGGVTPGTVSAFLVLEEGNSARARGATVMARVAQIETAWDDDGAAQLADCIAALPSRGAVGLAVSDTVSAPSETTWITDALVGYAREAAFPFQVALAALAIQANVAERALVTTARYGIAAALLEAAT